MTDSVRRRLGDALLTATLLAIQLPSVVGWPGPARRVELLPLAFVLVQAVPVLWRRSAPVLVVALTTAAYVFHAALDGSYTSPFFVPVVLYSVAAYSERRVAVASGILALAAVAGATGLEASDNRATVLDVLLVGGVGAVAWIAGSRIRDSRSKARALAERAAALEAGREAASAEAVRRERARIARELHDIVSHGVGVMVVQAAGARRVIDKDPAAAAGALAAIESGGRTALVELRRLLGVIRDGEPASLEPLPGLASVDQLATNMRRAGLDVDVIVEGEPREVSAGVGLSAYRIAQEALTNTLRHANARRATLTIRYEPSRLTVAVQDDGEGATMPAAPGLGLAGMRERVGLFGGTLTAGPRPGGGFAVEAQLPLTEDAR